MAKKIGILKNQSGNVLIYVLIAIALFAALGFTLSRQTSTSGTEEVDEAKLRLYATDLMNYAAQVRSVLDQMSFSGTDIDDYIFDQPGDAGFNTAPHIHKVFHPQGGGLVVANIPSRAFGVLASTPPTDWYLGRFNNVEWTETTGTDIILSAYNISQSVCEEINSSITGSATIPTLASGSADEFFVDTASDSDFTAAVCAACEGYKSLCVYDSGNDIYTFYSVIAQR
ncbi:MAG: hypothetical protein GC137_04855 [Alphaproteobacteria bacterium]|nr:hypothetical protein [Alphaproteobacteria bacterium]